MENPQRGTGGGQKILFTSKLSQVFFNSSGRFGSHYERFGQAFSGADRNNCRLILCLGLVNVVLLIVAIVLGNNCARITQDIQNASRSGAQELIVELSYLQSNHSDIMEAKEEAKNTLDKALHSHAELKVKIEQQEIINDNYQRQIELLQTERSALQLNASALEGSCGRCQQGWILHNSSCYFFSYLESKSVKKNWDDSRADCIRRGADLVVIDNPQEQAFVSSTIETMKSGGSYWYDGFWLGLTDRGTEGTWVWVNNVTEVEQRYWIDGEPNNSGHMGEDCADVLHSSYNPWKTRNDVNCKISINWLCEMASR